MSELGDETTAAAVAGCSVDPGPAVKLCEELAEHVGRERPALLAGQQSALGGGESGQMDRLRQAVSDLNDALGGLDD